MHLGTGAHIRVTGKGRKKRCTTADRRDRRGPARLAATNAKATPTIRCSRPAGEGRSAATPSGCSSQSTPPPQPPRCPSLKAKRVTPHTLRHTNAMLLRAKDVDIATIALWLGHESTKSTHIYEHADPALKEQAIARTAPIGTQPGRYRASDTLLAFLDGL